MPAVRSGQKRSEAVRSGQKRSEAVRSGQKRSAEQSAVEAKRSADAAAEMARIEQERRTEEVAEADRHRVRFVLDFESGSTYLLRNIGTDTAYWVHVDMGGMGVAGEVEDFEEFPPGEVHRYVLARIFGDKLDHIVVTWHHRSDRSDSPQSTKLYGP
jgi:hypothetical protein